MNCEAWNTTLNKSVVEVPANTFKPNQTYIVTLVVSAPGRSPSFDKQTVRHIHLFAFFFTINSYTKYNNKKTVLSQGNRAMPQLFFSV